MHNTIFDITKQGLETGLQVQHITTFKQDLRSCNIDDPRSISELFADPKFEGFDHIPVCREETIVGVISRRDEGYIKTHLQYLNESNLISAQEPLTNFIPLMATTPYRLVLQGGSIRGIVTWSDLLKLPVRLFAFSLVTHLEMLMAAIIRTKYPQSQNDGEWLIRLKPARQEKIRNKQRSASQENYALSYLEYTDFCDKRDIVEEIGQFGARFKKDFEKIEKKLRDPLAHAGDYAHNDQEIKLFITHVNLTEEWINKLQDLFQSKLSQEIYGQGEE